MIDEQAYTVPEVARRLRVTSWAVREWLRAGKLRGYRPGGTKTGWRVDEADLRNFIETLKSAQDGQRRPRSLRTYNDRPTSDQPGLTFDEAAARLGISREAVRLRVRRGTLRAEQRDGRLVVHIGDRPATDQYDG